MFDGVELGEGRIAAYGRDDWRTISARICLLAPVDDARWERAGGWHGFSLRVGAPTRLGVDAAEARAAVEAALASGEADLDVGTPHEESLSMLVSGERVFVMYLAGPGDAPGLVAVDPGGPAGPAKFTLDNGQVDEFDGRSTVDHATALIALDAFLAGEGPSPALAWSDDV